MCTPGGGRGDECRVVGDSPLLLLLQNLNNKLLALAGSALREQEALRRRSIGQLLYPINMEMDKFMLPAATYVCTRLDLEQVSTITKLQPYGDRHWLLPSHRLDKVFPELQKIDIDALMKEPMETQLDFVKHLYRYVFGNEATVKHADDDDEEEVSKGRKRKKITPPSSSSSEKKSSDKTDKTDASSDKHGENNKDSHYLLNNMQGRVVYKPAKTLEDTSPTKKRKEQSTSTHMAARELAGMSVQKKKKEVEVPPFSLFSKTVEIKLHKHARRSITVAEATSIVSAFASGVEKADIREALSTIMPESMALCYDVGGDDKVCVGLVSLERLTELLYAYTKVCNIDETNTKRRDTITTLQQDIQSDEKLKNVLVHKDY